MSDELQNDLSRWRHKAELTQQELAERVGISRQALSAIESGRSAPSTTLALKLARELECPVDELFWLDNPHPDPGLMATLAANGAGQEAVTQTAPVILGRVAAKWVAHPVNPYERCLKNVSGDGQLCGESNQNTGRFGRDVSVNNWLPREELAQNILVAGCAPPLAMLERQIAQQGAGGMRWIPRSSMDALDLLARQEVHMAGLHVTNRAGDGYNDEIVGERFDTGEMRLVTLTRWQLGLVVAPGNPLGVHEIEDLLRRDLRFVGREEESGAHLALVQYLEERRLNPEQLSIFDRVKSHLEAGLAVAYGKGDVGLSVEGIARGLGLDFIPLVEERFELVFPSQWEGFGPLRPVLDVLVSGRFRRQLAAMPGYDAESTGASRTS